MPIDPSIPLNAKMPDNMGTLGQLVNVARGVQAYRTGQATQQTAQVGAQTAQGTIDARKSVAALFSDPQLRDPDTGLIDLNKFGPAAFSADPMNYVAKDAIASAAQYNTDAINVKKNALGLADQSRQLIGSTVGALAADPSVTKDAVSGALDQLVQQAPDAKPAIDIFRRQLKAIPDDPNALRTFVMHARGQVMPASTQIESQTPGGASFNTGGVSGVINVKPNAGPTGPVAGTMTQNVVPPTAAESVGTDINGNPIRVVRSPQGVISLQPVNTAGGAPGGAQTPPMFTFPPGESPGTKADLETQRQQALAALNQAPLMHQSNRGVLENIDKTTTGVSGPYWSRLNSIAGNSFPQVMEAIGQGSEEAKASAYDLVGKYLTKNALQASQAMGPHTNMGLEAQIEANGAVKMNPTAIKRITKLNDAVVSGAEAYQPGLERAITSSPNQIFAKRQFDQQWASNFDPTIFQIANAKAAGDSQEIADLTTNLSPAQRQALAVKARNLKLLSTQGHL